ncbi:MAG: hypothetical protein HZA31_03070 [Opitutae bacterium]|nr:hypothetical protein [Opitutae bacterium]
MKNKCTPWVRAIIAAVMGFFLVACAKQSLPIHEKEYPVKIVGSWEGIVGGTKETMSIYSDGTFVCQTQPLGFIGKRLPQGAGAIIRGTWKIDGPIITLRFSTTDNEPATKQVVASTIVAFTEAELQLRADRGDSTQFIRVQMP